ncbi:MAG: ribbon-helix-helix protein, CopG family [Candidatus Korobacteraceae bacterium]|jgi:hypothetical protein
MKNTLRQRKLVSAEAIARLAEQGKDVSSFFTNRGRMMAPIQRVNVDFTAPMLEELDRRAEELNISRQAVIKTLVRQALDQHYLSSAANPHRRMTKPQ